MFDESALKKLASIETEGPILSVYLNVDPTQRTSDEYKLTLRDLLRQAMDKVDSEDIEAVKHYVEYDYDWSGRGLVIFTRQAEDIWLTYPLAVPVSSGVTVANRPYISPLVELDGLYGSYAIALVDRQGGQFYHFQMGELTAQKQVEGEDIHHTRKGRGSSVVGMRGGSSASGRRETELVQRNLKEIASALTNFCQKYRPRHLLIGGADPTVAQFQDLLSSTCGDLVDGTLAVDMGAGEPEIRERAFEILEALEQERHEKMVNTIVTATAKGMNGVLGLDQTLSMAHEGRIQVLIMERDYHQPGYRCTGCGYLTSQQLETCVFCGSEFAEIPDAVEAVVTQVVEKGGDVDVIDGETMGDARIGALLRY